jgi:hypothetical protein
VGDDPDFGELVESFRILEEACAHMYELIMKEKERSDELEKRINILAQKLDSR